MPSDRIDFDQPTVILDIQTAEILARILADVKLLPVGGEESQARFDLHYAINKAKNR